VKIKTYIDKKIYEENYIDKPFLINGVVVGVITDAITTDFSDYTLELTIEIFKKDLIQEAVVEENKIVSIEAIHVGESI